MQESGFSLIELMIVLSIISLLSGFVYPAYSRYWVQLKRLEARLTLLEGSVRLEKYAGMSGQGYRGANLQILGLAEKTERGWYKLSLEEIDERQYRLVAQPTFQDAMCLELSGNAKGQRFYKGSGSYHDCWGV